MTRTTVNGYAAGKIGRTLKRPPNHSLFALQALKTPVYLPLRGCPVNRAGTLQNTLYQSTGFDLVWRAGNELPVVTLLQGDFEAAGHAFADGFSVEIGLV